MGLNRRAFLRLSSLGLAGLAVSRASAEKIFAKELKSPKNVIIVGFGGGTRYSESFAPEGRRYIPYIWNELRPLGSNFSVKTITDDSGNYVLTPLRVGEWRVTAELTGFKRAVQTVELKVQDRLRVDFVLEVGELTEVVEVTAATPSLQTETSSLGHVVESKRIVDLPLNGRLFSQLVLLAPGVVPSEPGARDQTTGGFSANGVRSNGQNNWLLDGVDNNVNVIDFLNAASFVVGPPVDAIQEFKVQTNAYSAEFGRAGGGVVNITIRSGSNDFHGSFFEFHRNSALDARNFFDPPRQEQRAKGLPEIPPFKQNQFGGTFGGPIIRDKTFFFGDFQGTRIRQGVTVVTTVPTALQRVGNFTEPGQGVIYDPATTRRLPDGTFARDPFPGNIIPRERMDPVAFKLADLYPLPNRSGLANNFFNSPTFKETTNQFDVRIDHKFSDKTTMFGRFSFMNQDWFFPPPLPTIADGGGFITGDQPNRSRHLAIGITHIFSPQRVNEFRYGYSRLHTARFQINRDRDLSREFGIPGVPFEPGNGGFPQITITGFNNFGSPTWLPSNEFSNVHTFMDHVSIIHRNHTFKTGLEIRTIDFPYLQVPASRGRMSFTGVFTQDPARPAGTGSAFADFLLGIPSDAGITSIMFAHPERESYNFFVQDDWKVTPKLTLNMGLRYEYVTQIKEKFNRIASFNLVTGTLDIPKRQDPLPAKIANLVPVNRDAPRGLVPEDNNNFAPRFGLAYSVDSKTVVRSGYGIFYGMEENQGGWPNRVNNPPFFIESTFPRVSNIEPNPILDRLSKGFPLDALTVNPAEPIFRALDPKFRAAYVQQWNFTIQRDIGFDTTLEVAYIGTKGSKLVRLWNWNQVPPAPPGVPIPERRKVKGLAAIAFTDSGGSSIFHGMQLKAEKRFSRGLTFLASYTTGKTLDDSQSPLANSASRGIRFVDNRRADRGLANFDISQRFVFSYMWDLPFGRGRRFLSNLGPVADKILGGWQANGIIVYQVGFPFSVPSAFNTGNCDCANRPDLKPGARQNLPRGERRVERWFNTDAYMLPPVGSPGNLGPQTIREPGVSNWDFALFKNFDIPSVREGFRVQFRAEFFNLFNTPQFTFTPATVLQGGPAPHVFGTSTFGKLNIARPSRQIQFALKIYY